MAETPSSASTCTIMSAPLIRCPESAWAGDRGRETVSFIGKNRGSARRGNRQSLCSLRALRKVHAQGRGRANRRAIPYSLATDSMPGTMRHIIAILLQNEAGALARVAGLFSTRGYNIESLSVAPTDEATVSRITLVTKGSEGVIQQILSQLDKLVDVVSVEDM